MLEVQGMESDVLLHKSLNELVAVVVAFLPSTRYVCVTIAAKGIDEVLRHKQLILRVSRPKINQTIRQLETFTFASDYFRTVKFSSSF